MALELHHIGIRACCQLDNELALIFPCKLSTFGQACIGIQRTGPFGICKLVSTD